MTMQSITIQKLENYENEPIDQEAINTSSPIQSLSDSNDSENDDPHNKISSIEDLEERPNKKKKVNKKMNYAVPLQPMDGNAGFKNVVGKPPLE